jgi:hypothetical protein
MEFFLLISRSRRLPVFAAGMMMETCRRQRKREHQRSQTLSREYLSSLGRYFVLANCSVDAGAPLERKPPFTEGAGLIGPFRRLELKRAVYQHLQIVRQSISTHTFDETDSITEKVESRPTSYDSGTYHPLRDGVHYFIRRKASP